MTTAWSVQIGRFSGPYFPVFELNTEIYLLLKSLYSVQIRENTDQKNSVFGDFSRSNISIRNIFLTQHNTRTICEMCLKLKIKTPKPSQWHRSSVFIIIHFAQIPLKECRCSFDLSLILMRKQEIAVRWWSTIKCILNNFEKGLSLENFREDVKFKLSYSPLFRIFKRSCFWKHLVTTTPSFIQSGVSSYE